MDANWIAHRLEHSGEAIVHLVSHLETETARLRPSPGKWSILDVMCHLLDEEREDFRQRVDYTLHKPGQPWPGIDPEGWVTARDYASRDFKETLAAFAAEREESVSWLRGLEGANWDAAYTHPSAGELRAGDVLSSWGAHDLLHLRQLCRLLYQANARVSKPYTSDYAGKFV